jgi:hypothetical protein
VDLDRGDREIVQAWRRVEERPVGFRV